MTTPKTLYCRRCGVALDKSKSLTFCSAGCLVWSQVDPTADPRECWPWQGYVDERGYGRFIWNRSRFKSHRVAYESTKGPMGDLCALHKCDNPRCCNPHHIVPGSRADNVKDMDEKGRREVLRGSRHGCAKLSPDQVLEIRRLAAAGQKHGIVAKAFGVSTPTVQAIHSRRLWKHI